MEPKALQSYVSSPTEKCDWRPAFFGWCLAAVYLFVSAWTMEPIPTGDGGSFMATSVCYAQGLGLIYPLRDLGDPEPFGQHRFVHHMPLFSWLVGAAMPTAHPRWAFLLIALMRVIQLGLWAGLYVVFVGKLTLSARRYSWQIPLLLFGILSQSATPTEGRPEALLALLQAVAVVAIWGLHGSLRAVSIGVLLGFIGAAHPVGVILSAGAVVAFAGVFYCTAKAIAFLAMCGAVSIAVFAAVLAVSPNGLLDTLQGCIVGAKTAILPAWGDYGYFFLAGRTPFSGLLLAAWALASISLWLRYRERIRSGWIFFIGTAIFVGGAWYFSLRAPARNYNVIAFSPFAFATVFGWAVIEPTKNGRIIVANMLAGLCSLGWLRYALALLYYLWAGVSIDQARAMVQAEVEARPGAVLCVPFDGCFLFDNYDRMRLSHGIDRATYAERRLVLTLPTGPDNEADKLIGAGFRQVSGLRGRLPPRGIPRWAAGYTVILFEGPE